jgi:LPXTG-motif cell wall-anchored protein
MYSNLLRRSLAALLTATVCISFSPSAVSAGGAPQLTITATANPLTVAVGGTFTASTTLDITTPYPSGTTLALALEMQGTDGVVSFDDPPTVSAGLTSCAFIEAQRVYRCLVDGATQASYTITAVGRPTGVPTSGMIFVGGYVVISGSGLAPIALSPKIDVAIIAAPATTTTQPAATTTSAAPAATTTTPSAATTTVSGSGAIPDTGAGESIIPVAALFVLGGLATLVLSRRRRSIEA